MRNRSLRDLHGLSAILLGAFLALHIGNHIYGLAGQQAHVTYMSYARLIYRNPLVEALLVAVLVWQAGSGLSMAVRGWKTRVGAVAWLQAASGLYLVFFLLNHVGAVFVGRAIGLDTDFRFAAVGLSVPPFGWFFAPYYVLAVFSLFCHVGCAIYWNAKSRTLARSALALALGVGGVLGIAIVAGLAGLLYPVDIPPAYRAPYGG